MTRAIGFEARLGDQRSGSSGDVSGVGSLEGETDSVTVTVNL